MTRSRASSLEPSVLLSEVCWTRRLAHGLVGGDDGAQDVAQDVCVALLEARPSRLRPLRPWLRRVARNLVWDRARGARRRQAREERSVAVLGATVDTPEELLQRAELHRLLVGLVIELDEPLRGTVLRRYFEGQSAAEIAAASGSPAGTVRWRLKTALDQLRARLDERHRGARREWLRVLLPLVSSSVGPRRPVLGIGAALAGVVALTVLIVGAGRSPAVRLAAPSTLASVAPPGADGSGRHGGREDDRRPAPMILAECQRSVQQARARLAELRRLRHDRMPPSRLFRGGDPNLRATLELDGLIRGILAGGDSVFPSYTFECRTWACRLTLLRDDPTDRPPGPAAPPRPSLSLLAKTRADPMEVLRRFEPGWSVRLQTDLDLRARTRGLEMRAGEPAFDPLAGKAVRRSDVYLKLLHPSGKVMKEAPPLVVEGAIPDSAAGCRRSYEVLRAEIEPVRAEVEALEPPHLRYEAGAPNPTLAARFLDHVRQVVGDSQAVVDCRGRICRLSTREGVFENQRIALAIIWKGPLQTQIDRLANVREGILFHVWEQPRIDGRKLLDERIAALHHSGRLAACLREHPARGMLQVRLVFPSAGRLNDDDAHDEISVRMGGELGGTSHAACVLDAITDEIVAPGLPANLRGLSYDRTWPIPSPPDGPPRSL